MAEDILLYGLLAVAVGLAQSGAQAFGLPAELGIDAASVGGAAYYAAMSVVVLIVPLGAVRAASRTGNRSTGSCWGDSATKRRASYFFSPRADRGLAVALGVIPIFGALTPGWRDRQPPSRSAGQPAAASGNSRSLFFYPDLLRAARAPGSTPGRRGPAPCWRRSIPVACLIKGGAVYLGARVAREWRRRLRAHSAVALNARGGPEIGRSSVSLAAGIVSEGVLRHADHALAGDPPRLPDGGCSACYGTGTTRSAQSGATVGAGARGWATRRTAHVANPRDPAACVRSTRRSSSLRFSSCWTPKR